MKKIAIFTSFIIGFLSLGQEVLWIRVLSFAGHSVPHAFAYTLFLYLLGIAIGAFFGKKICQKNKFSLDFLGKLFLTISIFNLLALLLVYLSVNADILGYVLTIVVIGCSALHGVVFPIAHHLGSDTTKTGAAISNVYFANVFGCTLSPIIIGFFLLDYLGTQQAFLLLIVITLLCAAFFLESSWVKLTTVFASVAVAVLIALSPEKLIMELSKNSHLPSTYPKKIIEGRQGIIQIYASDDPEHDIVYGANVYDGKTNTDLFKNTNGIDRAYLLAASNIDAKKVLVIGLSTGSWVKVLSSLPNLESMTVIEINPDYVKLVSMYPEVSSILQDKRIHIYNADGRKWLNAHSDKDFDLVLMNTTWHWRSYASNLLSIDFLDLLKKKMSEDGVLMYNTTASMDAFYTAERVFPQVYGYKNMVIAKSSNRVGLTISEPLLVENLGKLKQQPNQTPLFQGDTVVRLAAAEILKNQLIESSQIDYSTLSREPEIITDINMLTEFKYGMGLDF